jgi:hypothetical protein
MRFVLVSISAALATAIAVAGAAASGPVPTATAGAIRKAAAPNAFLPRSVPSGYRYVGWKNENPNGNAAVSSGMFFVVTFAHGSSKLVWTVSLVPDPVGSPCDGRRTAGLPERAHNLRSARERPEGPPRLAVRQRARRGRHDSA